MKSEEFNRKYVSLDYSAAELLVKNGVMVVGIDYLSIEELETEEHPVHKLLTENEVINIETLDLGTVDQGKFFFGCAAAETEKL
ncbi:arylformamidase [Candidatus Methanophagaceae archaeon]|nr:arylformamidase [Methanophagales archaeon]